MKKYILLVALSISLNFISCKKSSDLNKQTELMDSIDKYFKIIDNSNIEDSLKIKYSEKALNISDKLKTDSLYFMYHFKTARRFYNLNLDNLYKSVVLKILNKSIKSNDTLSKAKAYLYLGDYYLKSNKKDSAFYFYDKSEVNYIAKKDYSNINNVRLNKAIIQFYEKDFIGCETNIFRSLAYFKKNKKNISLNVCYTLLGLCQIETKDYVEADKNLNLALLYSQNLDVSSRAIETANNNLGILFLNKEDYNEAIKYFEKVINEETKKDLAQIYVYAKQNLRYSKFKLGDIKNFQEDYNSILNEYKELNLSIVLPITQLSEYYESQNEIVKAQGYALEAYNISIKEKLYRDKLIALKQLTNVFPEKAKYYSSEYIKLNDSIVALDKKIQNTFARIEYKVDELNSEKELLEEHNKQIIYYALIGILLFALGFVYFWQKQKQKQLIFENNQQKNNEHIYQLMLDQQVKYEEGRTIEKRRIAKELHDGIMNKLAAVRFNLYALKKDRTDKTIEHCLTHVDEIQTIEKEIRTLSHDLTKEIFEKSSNFEAILQAIYWNNDEDSTSISYHFSPKIKWETISAEAKLNCYRIIQESVINCIKYAQAKNCSVSISLEDTIFVIKISDDGIGFDTQKVKSGIGLKNIAERVTSMKGKFKILATPNQGTTLFINVPINNITV